MLKPDSLRIQWGMTAPSDCASFVLSSLLSFLAFQLPSPASFALALAYLCLFLTSCCHWHVQNDEIVWLVLDLLPASTISHNTNCNPLVLVGKEDASCNFYNTVSFIVPLYQTSFQFLWFRYSWMSFFFFWGWGGGGWALFLNWIFIHVTIRSCLTIWHHKEALCIHGAYLAISLAVMGTWESI